MQPLYKIVIGDKKLETTLNQLFEDLYNRVIIPTPTQKSTYAALITDADRIVYLKTLLGL